MSSEEPPLVSAAEFLDEVEGYLEGRDKPLEARGRFDIMAYLAYIIGVELEQYEEFQEILRAASSDTRCRLNIVFNSFSGNLQFIGIKPTYSPAGWGKQPTESIEAQREQDALAKYYLAQFEITQLKAQLEKAKHETGEARADQKEQRQRADTAQAELTKANLELQRLHHVKVTDSDVTRLKGELASANRTIMEQAEKVKDLLQQVRTIGETFDQFRRNRENHICEVQGLRLLKTTHCNCLILADHRRCNGLLHLDIELETDMKELADRRQQEWEEFRASKQEEWKRRDPTYDEVIGFLKKTGEMLIERLHIKLQARTAESRMVIERLPLIASRGSRGIRRGLTQFLADPGTQQRQLSTYTVRKLGDM